MSEQASIERQVYDIVARQGKLDVAAITPEATLKDLGIDSLEAIEIIFDIEEHFGVTLPDRAPDFDSDSVQGLLNAVKQAVDAAAADKASSAGSA
ncbi:acyl carrier protein [Lysobacter sp. TAB13]|uniref:acyl carrier protein n=1 Tax=Lysobacter sp. TAB13 TaxID=3233065 RepID=UPI003F9A75D8